MTMLDRMRRHKGWLKWSLALVVLTFVVFYIPDFLSGTGATARGEVLADVQGEPITVGAFQRRYGAQLQAYRNAYGGQVSEQLLKQLGIQQQILTQLVDEEAMVAEARKQGITVNDVEIRERILAIPAFQENGAFIGEARYRQVLQFQNPPLTTSEFESNLRRAILAEKLRWAVTGWMSATDSEVADEYRRRNEKVKVDIVPITAEAFKSQVTVTDADVAAYFEKHKESYRVGEKRKIKYALVDVETGVVASAKVPRRWAALLQCSARFVAEPREGDAVPPVEVVFPDGSVLRSDDDGLDEALSALLGRRVRLASTAPDGAGFEELWPDIAGLAPQGVIDGTRVRDEETGEVISRFDLSAMGAPGTFFDLSPLHVLTTATLDRLRELAPDTVFDVRRYRPNVLLDGAGEGFVENDWPGSVLTLGGATVTASLATMRCVMTTLAQGDLPVDADVLRTVAKHNRIEIPQVGGVWASAGVYADVTAAGDVSVGDAHGVRPA